MIADGSHVETWISLPANRRPKSWDSIEDPVCRLRLNLYGHPLAGLHWEKHCHKYICEAGFEREPGWECLFVHRKFKLWLSVYVGDFKMAGLENLPKAWKALRKHLELDDAVPLSSNVYSVRM